MKAQKTVIIIAGLAMLLLHSGCGGDDDNDPADGDTGEMDQETEVEPVACNHLSDCLHGPHPMICWGNYCSRLPCGTSDSVCDDYDTQSLLPLMECRDGYCEKHPCNSENDCLSSAVNGRFVCIDSLCERILCESNLDCMDIGEQCADGICQPCNLASIELKCNGQIIVQVSYILTDHCRYTTNETQLEECTGNQICVEDWIDSLYPHRTASCQ